MQGTILGQQGLKSLMMDLEQWIKREMNQMMVLGKTGKGNKIKPYISSNSKTMSFGSETVTVVPFSTSLETLIFP